MNKANVFLLVVVSSLLTYISTATQPAATAGVAQEKWEYESLIEMKMHSSNPASTMSVTKRVFLIPPEGMNEISLNAKFDYPETSLSCKSATLKTFDGAPLEWSKETDGTDTYSLALDAYYEEKKSLLERISLDGWQVFQVSRYESETPFGSFGKETTFHLRRRVQ